MISIVSIVYEHCIDLISPGNITPSTNLNVHYVSNISQAQAMPYIVQPFKFGTICFFIISGYLLGKHLSINTSPWPYYWRRIQIIGVPFLIASGLFFLKHIGIYGLLIGRYTTSMLTPEFIWDKFILVWFLLPFWFIVSFLIALGLFLLFWPQSNNFFFGLITGTIAVFYGLNIYFGWIEQRHNFAAPAYLFYLWLGVTFSRNELWLFRIRQLPNSWLIVSLLISFGLAIVESNYLWSINSISPFNTIRLSNQLFSLSVFAYLIRNDFSSHFTWLKPRSESFGIYLYHLYFVEFVTALSRSAHIFVYSSNFTGLELAAVTLIRFTVIYTLTLLFVKAINHTRFRWLFGQG